MTMATYSKRGMAAYYDRDRDTLQRLLEEADAEVVQLRAYIAGSPAVAPSPTVPSPTVDANAAVGPSSRSHHTGRSERENVLAVGLGKS